MPLPTAAQDTAIASWARIKVFARFLSETQAVHSVADFRGELLAQYIEWLNRQTCPTGEPWSKATRSAVYGTLRKLLQWLVRCRPGLIPPIAYPLSPFLRRRREGRHRPKVSAGEIRALLRACEQDIEQLRHERRLANEERQAARQNPSDALASRGALVDYIDERFGGLMPRARVLLSRGHYRFRLALGGQYGRKHTEACLYPGVDTILPYYLAILIHTAGNAQAIADLQCECLQSIPLREDREFLLWHKPRATAMQRRSFRSGASLEPPTLVRELIEWTQRLRLHVTGPTSDKLFLVKSASGIRSLADFVLVQPLRAFETRYGLKHVAPSSIRPSLLTALYRSTGDLVKVKTVANHARLSTTVAYVDTPEVEAQIRQRIATLQTAFLGYIGRVSVNERLLPEKLQSRSQPSLTAPFAAAVSMFGFDCADPLAGVAPGTRAGELCSNFLGCFSCPNAVIPRDARTLARLMQARTLEGCRGIRTSRTLAGDLCTTASDSGRGRLASVCGRRSSTSNSV